MTVSLTHDILYHPEKSGKHFIINSILIFLLFFMCINVDFLLINAIKYDLPTFIMKKYMDSMEFHKSDFSMKFKNKGFWKMFWKAFFRRNYNPYLELNMSLSDAV